MMFDDKDKHTALLHDMLLNNVYNNFLYNRNLVNDPVIEQIKEMKLIQNEKEKRKQELKMLENLYPDDHKLDIVDIYIQNLELAANVAQNQPKNMIDISEYPDEHFSMKNQSKDGHGKSKKI